MAYRRSLSTRATLIAGACNNPSFSYIPRDHHERHNRDSTLSRREIHNFIQQRSSFGRVSQFSLGSAFVRYISTSVGEGGGSDNKIELIMSDMADVVSDATTTQVNEVAIAAVADSSWPVTVLQHFIDSVHNFTGLNWWASIVLATFLCRCAIYPLVIYQQQLESMKLYVTFKHFKEMLEDKDMDPEALADGQKQMQKAHEECCIPLPRISVLIDGTFTISSLLEMRCCSFSFSNNGLSEGYMLLFDYIKPGPSRLCTSAQIPWFRKALGVPAEIPVAKTRTRRVTSAN